MARVREFMHKQMHLYMSNWQYSLLYTLLLALIPHTSWLAVTGVSLLTLRKGMQRGALVLLPVAIVYYAIGLKSLSHIGALLNTLALFAPCFLGAVALRFTSTWHSVAGLFFLLTGLIAILVHAFVPELITAQYVYLQDVLQSTQPDAAVVRVLQELSSANQTVVASYVFGLQLLSIFLSASVVLLFARAIQSRMFNPGGFRSEALSFRANKLALFILLALGIAISRQSLIAMMLIPAVFIYFLLAGLSICASFVDKKNSKFIFVLFVPLVILPLFSVPFYSCLGLFDSLFSLRLYTFRPRKRG